MAALRERVACAAIQLTSTACNGMVLAGHRHHDIISMINIAGLTEEYKRGHIDGFMTTHGRFLNRFQAWQLQKRNRIESASPDGYRDRLRELFSEDLY